MEKATVQSIDRALSIIEALAGEKEGLGVTEISTRACLIDLTLTFHIVEARQGFNNLSLHLRVLVL